MNLSIIIPAFDEGEPISHLFNQIKSSLSNKKISYEVIIIDDGSNDNTWIASIFLNFSTLDYSKNFFPEY